MKFLTLKSIGVYLILLSNLSLAQNNWKIIGNGGSGSCAVNATSFLGTTNAFPLQFKTTLAQPINFFTANFQRMTINGQAGAQQGFIGIGKNFLNPMAMLHIEAQNNVTGKLFRTDGPSALENSWGLYTGSGNVTEKFKIFVPIASQHVFLQTTQLGAIMGFKTGGQALIDPTKTRLIVSSDVNSGRIAIGNNLSDGFQPIDRIHIYEDQQSIVRMRYTNLNTNSTINDGSTIGIEIDGSFRFNQFENKRIEFFTSNGLSPSTQVPRFHIDPVGRTYVGNTLPNLTNRFTIDSEWNATINPDATKSGLRFIDLTSAETSISNPGTGVLSVDANGNVIYVQVDPNEGGCVTALNELNAKIEEKDSIIDDLNARLSRLESCLSGLLPTLCEMNQQVIQQTTQEMQRQLAERISVSLSDKNTLVLSQNVPNPFAEKTIIEYSIPASVQKAQIHFYNTHGKLINSVELSERGNGELTVFANDLNSGVYAYTLVADGKLL